MPSPSKKWLLVVGSFICFFMADGCTYSFGAFYSELSVVFESRVLIALLSGLLFGLPQICGPVVCPFIAVLGNVWSCTLGCLFVSGSFVLASFVHSAVLLLVVFAIFASIGIELLYATALVAVLNNFDQHRGLATGITVFGGGIGAVSFAQIYPALDRNYTWRGAMFVEGAVMSNCLVAACLYHLVENIAGKEEKVEDADLLVLQPGEMRDFQRQDSDSDESVLAREWAAKQAQTEVTSEERDRLTQTLTHATPSTSVNASLVLDLSSTSNPKLHESVSSVEPPWKKKYEQLRREFLTSFSAMIDPKLWRPRFIFFCVLNLFIGAVVLLPWVFIHSYALGKEINAPSANDILACMGISYAIGQIGFGLLADYLNAYILFDFCVVVCGIACLTIGYCETLFSLMGFGILFALVMGGSMALYSLILVDLVGENRLYAAFGVYLPFVGVGNLIGSLLSGWASDVHSYSIMFKGGGALLLILSVLLIPLLILPLRSFGIRSVKKV